jgi:hypothetical protein
MVLERDFKVRFENFGGGNPAICSTLARSADGKGSRTEAPNVVGLAADSAGGRAAGGDDSLSVIRDNAERIVKVGRQECGHWPASLTLEFEATLRSTPISKEIP